MSQDDQKRASLTLFAHLLAAKEDEISLAQAALLFAETEYEELDPAYYIDVLDDLGSEAERILQRKQEQSEEVRMMVLVEWLYRARGFRGNAEAYYDPRNSYLNEVLDRKRGIPITLAIVLLEVCARAGVEAVGVSFPGHFLVRAGDPERPFIVDPFHGRILKPNELTSLASREPQGKDPRTLPACTKPMLLFRMLSNLRNIYTTQNDRERLANVLQYLIAIAPSPELLRELENLGRKPISLPSRSQSRSLN